MIGDLIITRFGGRVRIDGELVDESWIGRRFPRKAIVKVEGEDCFGFVLWREASQDRAPWFAEYDALG